LLNIGAERTRQAPPLFTLFIMEEHSMKDLISNQLVRYLEARGVEHIFGLCGHTNIAFLAALEKSEKIKFVNTRHEQIAAHMPTATRAPRRRPQCCSRTSRWA
jgi:glyoxylate carboligase